MKAVSGVYMIENVDNGKFYIGSSVNIRKRKNHHYSCLRNNKHDNVLLQRAWNKYGESSFIFSILRECDNCRDVEQQYLNSMHACIKGYNLASDVRAPALNCSAATRAKMSAIHKGRKMTEHTKAQLLKANKGRVVSAETRAKYSLIHKGKTLSAETRLKLSAANKLRTHTDETKAKMRTTALGRKISAETKLKMSLAAKARWQAKQKV